MSDVVSFTEIYGQHVELLPGRTMMLLANTPGADGGTYISGSTIDADTVDLGGSGGVDDGYKAGHDMWWRG